MEGRASFGVGLPPVPGAEAFQDWDSFRKAVSAGYGTDLASLTGGAALRVESLEAVLQATVQRMEHFRLFNQLHKSPAIATVDEWTEMNNTGGYPGSAFNTELGSIVEQTGSYARRVALVKYLMTRRSVSFVQNIQQSLIAAKAQEEVNGTLEILRSAEWAFFEGNGDVVSAEYDGLGKIIPASGTADQVIDAQAGPLQYSHINQAAQIIFSPEHFGVATDLYLSTLVQADLDLSLDPAFRVPLTDVPGGGIMVGSPVKGIRTSFGDIANKPDVFLSEGGMAAQALTPARGTTADPTPAVSVTLAVASDAASKFGAAHAGTYYYSVASLNKNGEANLVHSASQAVAAGEKCTLTITRSAAADESGYAIYRSKKGGTAADGDCRLMCRVACAGATTTYVDLNTDIPGTSKAYVLNCNPGFSAISIRQMLPMTRFQLYPTLKAEDPWAQLLFMYLRVTKARQHVVIKNLLPSMAAWKPF